MIKVNGLQRHDAALRHADADHRSGPLTQLRRLLATRPMEGIRPDEVLVEEGSTAPYVFEIVSGCVRRYVLGSEGRRTIIDFQFEGDIFGTLLDGDSYLTVEAVTVVEIRRILRTRLLACMDQVPELKDELLSLANADLIAAREHIGMLRCKLASEKVALFLRERTRQLSRQCRPVREVSLPMSRIDIADFLGLTIESVSRAFTELKASGTISFRGPRTVVLEDPQAPGRLSPSWPTSLSFSDGNR